VRAADNKILLALPRPQRLTPAELEALAGKVSAANQFGFDLGAIAIFGVEHAREKNRAGRVMRDQDLAPVR
jgi:hypothetical protein